MHDRVPVIRYFAQAAVFDPGQHILIDRGLVDTLAGVMFVDLGDIPGNIGIRVLVFVLCTQGMAKLVDDRAFKTLHIRRYAQHHGGSGAGQGIGSVH
ncbi:hypothetical protein D3C80_1565390 [compost metagenome]